MSYRRLAADAVAILDRLGIAQTDVVGWSDGGNTALLLALGWPRRVRRMVVISANFNPAGLTPEAHRDTFEASRGLTYWLRRWWTAPVIGSGRWKPGSNGCGGCDPICNLPIWRKWAPPRW
ncbi:alpha/beta fold hydrolase [Desulfosarcina cetonica]|uniref:alpha/beta fold hydrolase n=1 Tax=Desulfosarcina cetonica TaxID=90730 RepID=UPI0006D04A3B|nr:alpha/beta hydrolase [Desulfosarcina cetonica]